MSRMAWLVRERLGVFGAFQGYTRLINWVNHSSLAEPGLYTHSSTFTHVFCYHLYGPDIEIGLVSRILEAEAFIAKIKPDLRGVKLTPLKKRFLSIMRLCGQNGVSARSARPAVLQSGCEFRWSAPPRPNL